MIPLIDSDILCYEVGFAAETGWQNKDEVPPWEYVESLLEARIGNICALAGGTQPPKFYLTGSTNFRNDIAKRRKYKDRPSHKPWHYKNIKAHMKGVYGAIIQEGLEADDLMALEQTRANAAGIDTIICSRDKDLRAVGGWHYGWEMGGQPQFGPELVEHLGYIRLADNRKSIKGCGILFFYAQCLTGDTVDSILGLPKCGPIKGFEILKGASSEEDCHEKVLAAYKEHYGESAEEELLEQARLLNMTRRFEEGKALLWNPPNSNYEDWIDVNTGKIERTFRV